MNDNIRIHDESAADYDRQARECGYHGHELLFGMCYEFIKPGDKLLDVGIGTGLSSVLFAKAGVEIHGLDGSEAMLNICRKKNIAHDLKLFNLDELPLPYSDATFDHVICVGVFHFFPIIEPIVSEVPRIMKKDGIFAFTVAVPKPGDDDDTCEIDTPWDRTIFAHGYRRIEKLSDTCGLIISKKQRFFLPVGKEDQKYIPVNIFILRKLPEL